MPSRYAREFCHMLRNCCELLPGSMQVKKPPNLNHQIIFQQQGCITSKHTSLLLCCKLIKKQVSSSAVVQHYAVVLAIRCMGTTVLYTRWRYFIFVFTSSAGKLHIWNTLDHCKE